jgi:hypothetical protein
LAPFSQVAVCSIELAVLLLQSSYLFVETDAALLFASCIVDLMCRAAALAAAAARVEAETRMTPNQRRASALMRAAEDEKAR